MTGPAGDSGTGTPIEIPAMTDDEYLREPVPNCWSIRPRTEGPGPGAAILVGAGAWGRDSAPLPHPWPPPFTTIAWRLGHLSEMLTLRADEAALDMAGRSIYPYGSDPEDPFIGTVWWVNQELLHHGAEIALLRGPYRARNG